MSIIMLCLYAWCISAACKALKTAARRTKARRQLNQRRYIQSISPSTRQAEREQAEAAKREKQLEQIRRKEQLLVDRERAAAEKRRQQARKEQQRKWQAQNDLLLINHELEVYSSILEKAYKDLEKIEQKIKIDVALRSYDKENIDRKQWERIQKRVVQYERKIHVLETKAARAKFLLEN